MAGFYELDQDVYAVELQQVDDCELEMVARIWFRQAQIGLPDFRPETAIRLRLIRQECLRRGKPAIFQRVEKGTFGVVPKEEPSLNVL